VLAQTVLHPGTEAQFELCASDPMLPERWAGVAQLNLELDGEIGLEVPLNEETLENARRNDQSACMSLGQGPVLAEGDYAVTATYEELPEPAVADVPPRTRIVAKRALEDLDLLVVVLTWLGSILVVVFLALRARKGAATEAPADGEGEEEDLWKEALEEARPSKPRAPLPPWLAVLLGLLGMLVVFVGIGFVASGAAAGLATGVGLGVWEVVLGLLLIGGASLGVRLDACGLVRPRKWWWAAFPGAVVAGIGLMALAQLATLLVPSTSTSNVQLFVSWPSGMLSFAALAVAAPLAEEAFFRGFIYGALEKYSTVLAFLAAWLLFVAFHGSQTWGQWGALVGIGITGLGLTGLRAVSGSALVPATAHLTYNGLLAIQAFL